MSFNMANRVNTLDKTTQQLLYSIAEHAPLGSPTFTGAVSGTTPSMVGPGNVNNKSDVDVCFESNERSSNRQNTDHLVSVESLHNDTNHPCRKILFCHSWREEKFTIIVVQKKTMKRRERERERRRMT